MGFKQFTEVFKNVSLSNHVIRNLKESYVDSIIVNKNSNTMDISLHMRDFTDESCIDDFKKDILNSFSFISDVNVDLAYKIQNDDDKIIKKYWINILSQIQKESPVCFNVLKKADYRIEGHLINIDIQNNGAFLFRAKKIDLIIKAIIKSKLGLDYDVRFINVGAKKPENQEYKAQIKKIVSDAITEAVIKQENIPTAKKREETAFGITPNKGKGGRRTHVKIKDNSEQALPIKDIIVEGDRVVVKGKIISIEQRETKKGLYLFTIDITDETDSVTVKFFIKPEKFTEEYSSILKKGKSIAVKGDVQFDTFSNELNIMASELSETEASSIKTDEAGEKRVELHLHTQMSMMDGISPVESYIERAAYWGHKAIAVTDHGALQAFPEAFSASKKYGVKVIYGLEAYLVDDLGAVVQGGKGQSFDSEFVVFDIETTGFKKETDKIIEIGAVKIKNNEIVDRFSSLINPHMPLPEKITELTKITDDMLEKAPEDTEIIPKFIEFIDGAVLVAHNANFDVGFIRSWAMMRGIHIDSTTVDTVELSRALFPELSKHKLNIVAEHLGIDLKNHHRAVDDAAATAEIFLKCLEMLKGRGFNLLEHINMFAGESIDKKKLKTYHAVILVKNQTGLRNLYELVSKSHLNYFYRRPRIPKSEYLRFKEGLMIGTACEAGEFYKAVFDNKPEDYIKQLAGFYDYLEIQPTGNNLFMVREETVKTVAELENINKRIVEYGEKFNMPVVATCDAHFLNPEDEVYRRIIMYGEGFKDADNQAPLYYRNTEDMLKEFSYLGEQKAAEVVIKNTNLIADMIEAVKPIPDETFPPRIDGAEEDLRRIAMEKAESIYGSPLPRLVGDRLERELTSIIKNGFAVMYIIAQKLVWKSVEDGYLVGSRGSVGSSFAATMAGITEVNPLPPHYVCKNCRYSDFESQVVIENAGNSGCDLPDADCPRCGEKLHKDGHDIPFETFLGFDGDKEPDIDLNFSGEYQQNAHAYTEELFGCGHVFKAGTIGTLADKTAYGYVKKYLEEKNIVLRNAEINRLKLGCTGVKRTTGQHPGGLMIVPEGHSIYEFCPVQRPANDSESTVTTTHFDYHSISGRLLKLDILGHDVPTILRMLHDITGVNPQETPLDDKDVMSLFTSPEKLNVTSGQINCNTGSLGLPEFGTTFVRQMLIDTKPTTFSELVRISGLSHGTDVWFNNAQDLIKDNIATLKEVIPTRDDIMVYLIIKGVEKKQAFKIMENVRKGKGLTDEEADIMEKAGIPDWYIESCRRIKYMFPKGHAVAYVMNTFRIGYYKIKYPYAFYAATFSVKAEDFDYGLMCSGPEIVKDTARNIAAQGKEASAKDKNTLTTLELVLEMYMRGLKFVPLDLYKAHANKFIVMEDGLMPPLCTIQGLGGNAAVNIVNARGDGEFETIEDFRNRTKISKTVIELLKKHNILRGIPETNQISLFDL